MRQSWTDDRLDEFGRRIDERFDRVDERFDRVDKEMRAGFDQVDERFDRVEKDVRELRGEMNALQRVIIQFGGALIASNLGLMAAVIGLMITQL